jgi:hypothetical protein
MIFGNCTISKFFHTPGSFMEFSLLKEHFRGWSGGPAGALWRFSKASATTAGIATGSRNYRRNLSPGGGEELSGMEHKAEKQAFRACRGGRR